MTLYRLKRINDFHGTNLGAAGDGSTGKGGPDHCNAGNTGFKATFNHGYQMEYIIIGFQTFVRRHFHRIMLCHPGQVIAHQIHNHGQFSIIFGAQG